MNNAPELPEISVVVPAFREEAALPELVRQVVAAVSQVTQSWELVIVDDGSKDRTWAVLSELAAKTPGVRGIKLARNFGHQGALACGMDAARGRAVVSMDADLQHPPALIGTMVAAWRAGSLVVQGLRHDGAGVGEAKSGSSSAYYALFRTLTGIDLAAGSADFRLLDRSVVEHIKQMPGEDRLFLRGLVGWLGYPTTLVPFECGTRVAGVSKYTLSKMLKLAATGLLGYSSMPLKAPWVFAGLALLGAAGFGVRAALAGSEVAAAAAVMLAFGAALFATLGIFGAYLGLAVRHLRRRPIYLVETAVGAARQESGQTAA
jgi:dolichol-phosphate mannosyltransferase